jgi:hypothetical protein
MFDREHYLDCIVFEYVPDMAVAHFHGRKTPDVGRNVAKISGSERRVIGQARLEASEPSRHADERLRGAPGSRCYRPALFQPERTAIINRY